MEPLTGAVADFARSRRGCRKLGSTDYYSNDAEFNGAMDIDARGSGLAPANRKLLRAGENSSTIASYVGQTGQRHDGSCCSCQ